MRKLVISTMSLESFRFEDKNEYRYDITLKVFARVVKEKETPWKASFSFFFCHKKISTVIYTEGGKALSR